ncbi:MAG: hypothetical protein ACRD3W_14850 [Terriglobales bacterium]
MSEENPLEGYVPIAEAAKKLSAIIGRRVHERYIRDRINAAPPHRWPSPTLANVKIVHFPTIARLIVEGQTPTPRTNNRAAG